MVRVLKIPANSCPIPAASLLLSDEPESFYSIICKAAIAGLSVSGCGVTTKDFFIGANPFI